MKLVLQDWLGDISMMQQTVLLAAIRGPDGMQKYGPHKMLLRWYRRCILLSAMDGKVLDDPYSHNGGSFTGRSIPLDAVVSGPIIDGTDKLDWRRVMDEHVVGAYLRDADGIPQHFQNHLMHAAEIVGYKHPDKIIRDWWKAVYFRLVNELHLHPETEEELDKRLGDTREGWLERADPATAD